MYSMNNIETRVDAHAPVPLSSSMERIVDGPSRSDHRESEGSSEIDRKNGISKTVEFEYRESHA